MNATDEIEITLPDGIDEDSRDEEKRLLKIKALSEGFRESVKSKGTSDEIDDIIAEMQIEDVNDLIFNDPVPDIPGRNYYSLIDEFLSTPDSYNDQLRPMADGYLSTISDLQKKSRRCF